MEKQASNQKKRKKPRAEILFLILISLFPISISALSPDGLSLLSLISSSLSSPLPSWNPNDATPCSWPGVSCSPDTRVISLSLPNVFLNLSALPPELSALSSLQILNLSSCNISGGIPPYLGSLSSLRALDLSCNSISGEIPAELGSLSSLKSLILNANRLTGSIPPALSRLLNIEVLCLQDNQLGGSIPQELRALRALQQLRLGGNAMIAGEIPPELGELSNLTVFGAAATAVSGEIPPELGQLKLLQTLSIYNTAVSGAIPKELGSLSELRNLYLHLNRLKGNIPPELGNLQKLNSLLLWGNTITGMIPRELGNCSSLVVLDLSGNEISGEIPGELGKLSLMEQLHLSENSISGVIPVELVTNCRSLTTLQLDNNEISGEIPEEIGWLKSLQLLFLWGNSLWGKIPRALGNCSELYSLDLSKNKLSGDIPGEIFELKKLSKLLLLGNSLTGELPGSLGSCQSLVRLRLGENRLSGQIPTEIGQLNNLVFLDLFSNNFTGRLPQEIGSMSLLEMLDIHDNQLEGEIPFEIGRLVNLEQLDLGGNAFSGEIPTSIGNLNYLNKLVLCKNWLTGELPKSLGNLKRLTLLDLSFNLISGAIPAEIGSLTSLTISLTLSSNNLTGQLPREMARLTQLQSLDLSVNNISGGIAVLGALTSLTSLNISDNNFSGPIPVNPFFKTASSRSYSGNPGLCQSSDGLTCSADVIRRTTIRTIKKAALVCVILGSITVAVLATWMLFSRGRYAAAASPPLPVSGEDDFSHPWTFTPFQKFSFTVDEILACIKVENVIGKGCSGAVYRAEMPGGDIIAVKKLWKSRPDDPPANFFESEIEILGRIRHRNIVRLLGYCSNRSVKLLLYNFIPNGNLQQLLRENRNLDWETRYRIALGAAQGLSYLHHDCVPPILHRDVKCNNILLDSKYEACIADFGLAKSMGRPTGISRIAGSYGYIAPEYGYTTNITEKSDVYSYGVVLLEILSGRSAVGEGEGLHIVEWARKKMGDFELAVHLLDEKLRDLPEQSVQEMLQALGVAMFCVNSVPSDRPTMKEVVALLTEVRSPPEEWGREDLAAASHQVSRPGFQLRE